MAGFGSLSLAQTLIGTLLDQRAVVLYSQPKIIERGLGILPEGVISDIGARVWGGSIKYNELFSGIISELQSDALAKITNITGANPYSITYMNAKVNIESDLCDHPIETGRTITDSSVNQPVSATVEVAMPTFFAERIYNTMYELQQKKTEKIILQTKYGVYKNLVLQGFAYSLEPNSIDRAIFTLQLREVVEVEPYGEFSFLASKASNMANASDADTVSNGTQVAGV